jgi:uncharacterized protein YegL
MNEQMIQQGPLAYKYGSNYDPNSLDSDRVVLLAIVTDCSGSIYSFEDDFTRAIQEFIKSEQNSHIAEELLVQFITFGGHGDVRFDTGFQPITAITPSDIVIKNRGSMTAGYDAVRATLDSMLAYGATLEQSGTDVRYNVAIITDGEFNDGNDMTGKTVVERLDAIRKDESKYSKFTMFMYGVGDRNVFDKTRQNMGLDASALITYGASGADFKKMLSTVSQSVSKSSSGTAVPTF